jgi:signal transduction histidine kinase
VASLELEPIRKDRNAAGVELLTVIFAIGVALGYFALAFVVLPRIDLVDATPGFRRAFRVGGVAFFAGCGLTHTHIATHAAQNGDLVAPHELVFHALQFVGVWVFVYVALKMIDVRVEVRRKPEDVLKARVSDLARSNEDLEAFAHVVSHDLRGPLQTAAGFATLLERKAELGEREREFLGHIQSSHAQMHDLLEGVLRYSRAAGEGLRLEPVELGDVVEDVRRGLLSEIEQTDATIVATDLPLVQGDPVQLRQLFANLVGNALKFRTDVAPRIEIAARRDDDRWAITVRDHGPGVAAQDREAIFEMFGRGTTVGEVQGSGIGLAVCQKIVVRHGGRISVDDAPGGGAVFTVELPVVEAGA